MPALTTLVFTSEFLESLAPDDFDETQRRHLLQTLTLLDADAKNPALRVYHHDGD